MYGECVAVYFVQVDAYLYEYFDSGNDIRSGFGCEVSFQQAVYGGPDDSSGFGSHFTSRGIFVDQFEITVSRVVFASFAHLGTYPVTVGQGAQQLVADKGVELEKG